MNHDSAEEDEESTLSSLLDELDDIRNSAGAVLDDDDDDDDDGRFDPLAAGRNVNMNETFDAPPSKPKQVCEHDFYTADGGVCFLGAEVSAMQMRSVGKDFDGIFRGEFYEASCVTSTRFRRDRSFLFI